MRSGVPWSVKGIEPEAREAAKQAARRSGMTLGAWLNQVILESGTDEVNNMDPAPAPQYPAQNVAASMPSAPSHGDLGPVAEAVRDLVRRVDDTERRTLDIARKLEAALGKLTTHIDRSEYDMDDRHSGAPQGLDPLERRLRELGDRLGRSGQGSATQGRDVISLRADDARTLHSLEKAMTTVVDHIEATERRTDETLSDIRKTLSTLANRMENAEHHSEREDAKKQARALEKTLSLLTQRLEKMETGVSTVSQQAVEAALKAIDERSKVESQRATIEKLQKNLEEMNRRLEQAERRHDEVTKAFETTISGLVRQIEGLGTAVPATNAGGDPIHARLEEMAARLEQNEKLTLSSSQAVERALAGITENLQATSGRDSEAMTSLQAMIEGMTSRLSQLEQEAKAARQSPFPAQFAPGFPPPAFGLSDFDAPPMRMQDMPSGLGGNFGPAFGPDDWAHVPPADVPPTPPAVTSAPPYQAPPAPPAPVATTAPAYPEPQQAPPPPPPLAADMYAWRNGDDGVIPPEPTAPSQAVGERAANDFLAAARRAAQAASESGPARQDPYYGPTSAYGASPSSAAYADSGFHYPQHTTNEDDERRRKILIGVGVTAFILLLLAALYVFGNRESKPTTPPISPAITQDGEATTKPTVLDNTPPATVETTPDTTDTEAPDEALVPGPKPSATDTPPASQAPAVKNTETKKPAPVSTKPLKRPTATPAGQATLTPASPLEAVPAKPVTTTPSTPVRLTMQQAAEKGDAAAQYALAERYADGDNGSAQDLADATKWFERAAQQGLVAAQYRLATHYEKGRGTAQDDAKAREWYQKAATGGNVKAMHNLAVIHAEGRGTAQDFKTAAHWFAQAANYGLGDSQYNLAILNERGLGIEKNLIEAYKWLDVAARGGDTGAAAKRDALATELPADDLAKAKAAASSWRAKKPNPVANGDLGTLKKWDTT